MKNQTKEQRISLATNKLRKIFKDDLDSNKKNIALSLIKEIAYMAVTLEDLKADKSENTNHIKQGKQDLVVMSANLKAYNSLVKNYITALKQLDGMFATNSDPKKDELGGFLEGNKE